MTLYAPAAFASQMVGRAGRPQFDTEGVAVIMTQNEVGRLLEITAKSITTAPTA